MTLIQLLQGKTPEERLAILYRIQERLRLRFNEFGERFRNAEITRGQFLAYKRLVHRVKQEKISKLINAIRENQDMFTYGDRASETPTNTQYALLVSIRDSAKLDTTYDNDFNLDDL